MTDALIKSLLVLADVVEARDPYTGGHVWRVSQFSKLLAIKMGLSEKEAVQISLGGYVHDLGKVAIPDNILLKEGKLTSSEYAVMKTHPAIGKKLINAHPLSEIVCKVIIEHHERLDGKGYPFGLKDEEISLAAKIVSVADMLDALTSARPYRREMTLEKALQIIESGVGTQFDSKMIDHICELGRDGDISHIVGHSAEEIPLVTCPVCGPVIAVQRTTRTGENVFCRACKGKFILHQKDDTFEAEMVSKTDNPVDLQSDLNSTAIDDLMKEFAGGFD
ncbi:MAG: HD-GYP domain-containing protein [Anaerolineae bacterium]|jgi:HD-GYP domain-containing protein (c-di-GMP phosphodiesterase class II)|nr:HD-GYP domain-containing protein [Anaerolineae bacterium]MBT3712108.1 HD-GYP domain-containing protein [Anaerolineae bacterium]MBT4309505.1 HD-GYP domain-containing protein [Anaerolineae bacterium]MBT4843012.1 HD-GYP domain-containing protein [Anaerolineae bacterium]MBT6060539.1 HD-GYP domain-containing protein [Anaerolineae bacterium]